MNKKYFVEGIKKLQLAYNTTFSNEKLIFWWEQLKNMDDEKFIKRIDELVKTNKYMPNIAEILDKKANINDYQSRDYSNFDFNSLLANSDILYKDKDKEEENGR